VTALIIQPWRAGIIASKSRHGEKLTTRTLTKNVVFEYIEIYYNRKRLHSTIGYENPESFEIKMVA